MNSVKSARLLTANFLLLCVGSLFFYISFHMLLSTLPTYILDIGGRENQVGLVIGAFATSSLIFRMPVGWLLDRRGATKGLIVLGTLLFLAASILYRFTHSVPALLAVRLLHGSGMAAYATASSTLVAHITPPERRGEAMGVFGMASNLSMGFGPFLGVLLLQKASYNTVFLASAAAATLGVLLAIPVKDHAHAGHTSQKAKSIFYARALFPSLTIFAACLTYGIVVSFLPVLTKKRDLGNPGSFFLVYAFSLMLMRAPIGRLSDRIGRAGVIAPGMLVLALAMALVARAHSAQALAVAAAVYALGFACVQSTLMAMVIDRVPSDERGGAMGLFTAGWELGIALGSAVFGAFLSKGDYSAMFMAGAISAALGGLGFIAGHALSAKRRGSGRAVGD